MSDTLADLKELRTKLDRLIAKYEREAITRGDIPKQDEVILNYPENNLTKEGFWSGNDIY